MTAKEFKETIRTHVLRTKTSDTTVTEKDMEWIFDFRSILLQPDWIHTYAELFWERFRDKYPFQVCGIETAGIPLVAAIVMKGKELGLSVNGMYIRKSRNKRGLTKVIEGTLTDHKIVVVDDLMNSGRSVNFQIEVLRDVGKKVSDVFAIVLYRSPEKYTFLEDITLTNLFSLADFNIELPASNVEVPKNMFEILWRFQSKYPTYEYAVTKSAPAIDEENIYVGSDHGVFWAINQIDGSVVWSKKIGFHPKRKGIFSSAALHNGIVYFGGYDGNLYALNAKTGKQKWINLDADWIGSSPSLAPDLGLLFVGLEFGLWGKRGGIAAISMETGKTVWEVSDMPEFTHCSPLYIKEEGVVVIGSNDGVAYSYAAASGEERWRFQTGADIKSCFSYDATRRLIVFGSFDGFIYALRANDGTLVWEFETGASITSIPRIHHNIIYASSLDKYIYALDSDTGSLIWKFQTAGRICATPVVARGSLWIGSNDGRLYELHPLTGTLKSFLQVTERVTNAIAYNETTDRIFLPTFANELYCIKKKEP